jgi:cell division protein FtsX
LAAVPGATLDDHKLWLDNLLQLGERLEGAAYGVLMIVAMAAFVVVVFATRSSLVAHNRTIELLHIMGAEDSYIAHQFSRRAFYMGLIGGAIGLVAASIVLYIVGTSASGLEEGWLPKMQAVKDVNISDVTPITWTEAWIPEWLRDNWAFVLYLLLLPLISGILSLMCTWITVMARLRRVI